MSTTPKSTKTAQSRRTGRKSVRGTAAQPIEETSVVTIKAEDAPILATNGAAVLKQELAETKTELAEVKAEVPVAVHQDIPKGDAEMKVEKVSSHEGIVKQETAMTDTRPKIGGTPIDATLKARAKKDLSVNSKDLPLNALGLQGPSSATSSSNDAQRSVRGSMPPPPMPSNRMTSNGPEEASDDAASVSGPIKSTRKRKTEQERIDWFNADIACEKLEPHRVLCKACHTWIELHPKLKYVMKPWATHRRDCCLPEEVVSISPLYQSKPPSWASDTSAPSPPLPIQPTPSQSSTQSQLDTAQPMVNTSQPLAIPNQPPSKPMIGVSAHPDGAKASGNDAGKPRLAPLRAESTVDRELSSFATAVTVTPTKPTAGSSQLTNPRKRPRESSEDRSPSPGITDELQRRIRRRARWDSYVPAQGTGLWHALTAPIRSFVDGFLSGFTDR